MSVLVEAISVVADVRAVNARLRGGMERFGQMALNRSLCSDGDLARIGVMVFGDVQPLMARLEAEGLVHLEDGWAKDFVVMDQQRGPFDPCQWAEFGTIDHLGNPERPIAAARLVGSVVTQLYTPASWTWENSLSRQYGTKPPVEGKQPLEFLRREGGLDVYRDPATGEEKFVARSFAKS